ncbi:MAG: pyridoxamine 5'-phosphate oxidase [Rhodothermales bacterium]|nr:pyridoxamine 5'-phosphate oxidase [Rhodothermales bacterium]
MTERIEDLRKEYTKAELDLTGVRQDPIEQFGIWFDEAGRAAVVEPNAMVLCTVSGQGKPSSRVVLLKGFNDTGFSFYTNYESRKGRDIEENPFAALTFWWISLERQVRIEGRLERVSAAESDRYFSTRPRGSQLGAWASAQSSILSSRGDLEQRLVEVDRRFSGRPVERPPHWGGYVLDPDCMEFWQGRASRLHDRICYTRKEGGSWKIERLSP